MTVDSADAAVGFESSSDRPSCTAMLVAQLAAYAIFALVCVAGWLWGIGEAVIVVVAAAALLAFVIAWPLRADVVARIVAAIAGAVSIAAAALPADILGSRGECIIIPQASLQASPADACAADGVLALLGTAISHWASTALVLLALLIIGGFLRQMLREQRTELVRSLSSFVLGGVAAVGLGGWVIVARVLRQWHDLVAAQPSGTMWAISTGSVWILCAVAIAAVAALVAMAFVSRQWWRDVAIDSPNPAPWLGFGLLPVLIFGLAAFAYAFALVTMV
ncbi:MAG: hypothetical protein LKG16_07210 [Bifidobacterium subtile]|jgi:hypothetical protein|uniref:hypothetical protein n=1 Tax=Bifidobacterium subtile TaxID=77635 RepID=UPI002F3537A5|nr:hypothetical protein [Bifidobacterium subtile]MCI1241874.1 hypothetical protein [Bifidobacterium subtile]MCI1258992.1 hypothetical protein [Bifidobacterium subtile]